MIRYPIQSRGNCLFFEINLIGYKNLGESIVLDVKDELNNILWTGVVDCYKYKGHNKTKLLLETFRDKGKEKVDFLCISHPDLDHIKSISKIIDNYTDVNTMILMPDFTSSYINQTKEIKAIKESLKQKIGTAQRRSELTDNILFNRQLGLTNLRWKFVFGSKNVNLQIESLTPPDIIMLNSIYTKYQQFKNDFSICLKIIFNDNAYLFMGDCSDVVLMKLDEEYIPSEVCYLKVPHHACKNETMESYIDNGIIKSIDVTGCAYRKNTTLKETLDFYSKNSNLVSVTGNIEHEKNIYSYGYLRHVFDVETGELISEQNIAEGNAIINYEC